MTEQKYRSKKDKHRALAENGVTYDTFLKRMNSKSSAWTEEDALTTPSRKNSQAIIYNGTKYQSYRNLFDNEDKREGLFFKTFESRIKSLINNNRKGFTQEELIFIALTVEKYHIVECNIEYYKKKWKEYKQEKRN